MAFQSLQQQLLLAMPALQDAWFEKAAVLLLEHTPEGAMGFCINKPAPIKVQDVFEQLDINTQGLVAENHPVLFGGPVEPESGFILHPPTEQVWESSQPLSENLWLTHSKDILQAIGADQGPKHSLIILGYAGWDIGQLEYELSQNTWLNVPCPEELLFSTPLEERWHHAAQSAGINLALISSDIGHA